MIQEGKVGPQKLSDGSIAPDRLTGDGSVGVQQTHAEFQEAVFRGNVYSLATNGAVTTSSATNFGNASTSLTPILALYNPAGTGKDLVLWRHQIGVQSGTVPNGGYVWAVNAGVVVSTAQAGGNGGLNNLNYQTAGHQAVCFSNTALTWSGGSTACSILRNAYVPTSGAAAASTSLYADIQDDGDIIVAPGNLLALCSAATGNAVVSASLSWEEVSST